MAGFFVFFFFEVIMKCNADVEKSWQAACQTLSNSYSPYSEFQVAAGLLSADGRVFTGCNVENASYGATICAERVAFFKAVSEGVRNFSALVVVTPTEKMTPPCALCLQVLAEFCPPEFPVYLANCTEIREKYEFVQLLTRPFGPAYLS
jgi:cytidine deaminase